LVLVGDGGVGNGECLALMCSYDVCNVSHSSETRLLNWRTGAGLDLFIRWFSFLYVYLFCDWFYLDCYFLTSGAPFPGWVKPTDEEGGLFLLFFAFIRAVFLRF
jgi:hypothetical protein